MFIWSSEAFLSQLFKTVKMLTIHLLFIPEWSTHAMAAINSQWPPFSLQISGINAQHWRASPLQSGHQVCLTLSFQPWKRGFLGLCIFFNFIDLWIQWPIFHYQWCLQSCSYSFVYRKEKQLTVSLLCRMENGLMKLSLYNQDTPFDYFMIL